MNVGDIDRGSQCHMSNLSNVNVPCRYFRNALCRISGLRNGPCYVTNNSFLCPMASCYMSILRHGHVAPSRLI